jgi:hypothetical protein
LGSAPQSFEQTWQPDVVLRDGRRLRRRGARKFELDKILKAGAAGGPSKLRKAIERTLRLNPQLSEREILKRTAELKLTNWYRPWALEEKDYVLEHAREFSIVEMARNLGRTPEAVYQMLWRNKESARVRDGYTQQDLAQIFHVSPKKVREWVRLGWLTTCAGRIKDRGLNRFLKEHRDAVDAARIDKEYRLWFLDVGLQDEGAHSCDSSRTSDQTLKEHVEPATQSPGVQC